MSRELIHPVIHTNGDSAQELFNQFHGAWLAVKAAIEAMGEATPNDRNYYIIDPDAGPRARRLHSERIQSLVELRDDLMAFAMNIQDDSDEKVGPAS